MTESLNVLRPVLVGSRGEHDDDLMLRLDEEQGRQTRERSLFDKATPTTPEMSSEAPTEKKVPFWAALGIAVLISLVLWLAGLGLILVVIRGVTHWISRHA